MCWLRRHRVVVTVALAATAPLAVAAVLVPVRATFAATAVALVLIAVIVAVAIAGSRASGYLTSASSALWFDFFFTRPFDSFDIQGRAALEITICLVVVGILITELAERSRHHHRSSDEETTHLAMVRELAHLAQTSTREELIRAAEPMMADVLLGRACHFDSREADPPLARVTDSGEVIHAEMVWPVETMGIPGPETEIVVAWRGRTLGRFILTPTPGEPVSRERRRVAATMATVVAAGVASDRAGR